MKNQIRLLWLKIAATLAAMMAGGCMAPINTEVVDDVADVVVEPMPELVAGNAVSLSMDAEQFANLAKWLGHGNTLSIEKAVHVQQNNVTLDAKAGTRFSYEMADTSGKFTFQQPYPTIKAGLTKLIGGVALHEVTINGDGSGVAATGLGRYRFRWLDEEDAGASGATSDLPEVLAYSRTGCAACEVAKREFAAAKDLPFRVTWTNAAPAWVTAYPTLHWQVSGDDWRQRAQWDGVGRFVEMWRRSREPKKTSAANNSFQPDRPNELAVASVIHHFGHDCPRCGRVQLAKQSDNGPTHTHRCGACKATWWHSD